MIDLPVILRSSLKCLYWKTSSWFDIAAVDVYASTSCVAVGIKMPLKGRGVFNEADWSMAYNRAFMIHMDQRWIPLHIALLKLNKNNSNMPAENASARCFKKIISKPFAACYFLQHLCSCDWFHFLEKQRHSNGKNEHILPHQYIRGTHLFICSSSFKR